MGDQGTARYRSAVVNPANQAIAIDVENLFRAVRCNVIRKHDSEPPAFFAVLMPRLDFFRLEPGQCKDERRIEVIPHRVAAEIGEIQIVPRSFDGMAVKGSAGVLAVLDGLSVPCFDEGPVRSAYAACAVADKGPIADPLVSGVGRDVNGFEGVGPALACPHRAGDGVELVGPVERERHHAVTSLHEEIVGHRPLP